MPRQLDHYGMDLSGFGRAFGGGSGGNQAGVTADGGIVIPKESLFRKKINFDANGNPLTDSANGRDLFAQLAIQKRLREAKLGDTKDVLNTMSGNKVNETKSEIEGKSNAELKHLAAKSGEDRKTRDTSAEHQAAMAHLNAIAPHLSDTAKAEAMASISTSNKTAREADSRTTDFFKKANDADLSIKDATANHLNRFDIGQGGSAIMGKGGAIASLLQPHTPITDSIRDPVTGFPSTKTTINPASVQNSMFNKYGTPGSGFNNNGSGATPPQANTYPQDNTTVPNVVSQRGDVIAALAAKAATQQPAPTIAPALGTTQPPAMGATSADYLKNLTSIGGGDASAAKLRNLFGTSAAAATGAFPEQLGSSIFKTAPNLMYNGDIKSKFDTLPDDIRQSVYNDVLRKMGIGVPGDSGAVDPRVKGINRGMGAPMFDSRF